VLTDGQKTIVYGRQGALYPVIVPMDGMIHTVADSFLQIEVKYLGEADTSPALIVCTTVKIVALDAIAIIADCDSGYASGSNVRSRCELVHISECKFLRSEPGQPELHTGTAFGKWAANSFPLQARVQCAVLGQPHFSRIAGCVTRWCMI
jgi:hypothetical protein